jgi:hypothetical protein
MVNESPGVLSECEHLVMENPCNAIDRVSYFSNYLMIKPQEAAGQCFPKQHWHSIKSTYGIESIFASVKLRTNAAKQISSQESALYLVFKLVTA